MSFLPDTPPGEDNVTGDENYSATNDAMATVKDAEGSIPFLKLVQQAEEQGSLYMNQVNRNSWSKTLRAWHQEHFNGSKYTSPDFKNRSKLFVPKTRSAVKKDMAAVGQALHGTVDAITCMAGNEGDPHQRAAAAVMQELVNYRTNRTSGKAAMPWYLISMGARQDAVLMGICVSKIYWKLEGKVEKETVKELNAETQQEEEVRRKVWKPSIDRPDVMMIAPENFVIDPSADWTNPAQSAAYLIIKFPMTLESVTEKTKDLRKPWKKLSADVLRSVSGATSFDAGFIRRSREQGLDRFEKSQQSADRFRTVWVYESFFRIGDTDYTFFSLDHQALFTDPEPVEDVYPHLKGERPVVMGYGALESHRIFPMSSAESWQMNQIEINDLRNLSLDAIKQNVMPIPKVRRGRQVDLEQLRRRAAGSAILVNQPDDVTWDKAPDVQASVVAMSNRLDIDFDDTAGQFNSSTVQSNNDLNRTLGGLKLVAGSANTVQEMDIRHWIETWCEPVLAQIVKLEQYYEDDPVVLSLCGERAQLMDKFGVSAITDKLLEEEVTIRVNVGLGAGSPEQKLQKFAQATSILMPILQHSPKFMSGELSMNEESIIEEVYGAAGYKDGGKRFISKGQPRPTPPGADAATEKDRSTAALNYARAEREKAGAGLDKSRLMLDAISEAMGHHRNVHDRHMQAADMGHRHATALLPPPQAMQLPGGAPPLPGGESGPSTPGGVGGPPPPNGMAGSMPPMPPMMSAPPGGGVQGGGPPLPGPPGMPPPATGPLQPHEIMPFGENDMPPPQPAIGRAEIENILHQVMSRKRQKTVHVAKRDPLTNRIAELHVRFHDGGPGPRGQIARVLRDPNGSITGAHVEDVG